MQGMIRCGLIAGCLVACHTSAPGTPDGGGPDGSTGTAGMHVVWQTEPMTPWPGAIDTGFDLDSVTFQFDNFKVIGDGGPGDNRTSLSGFALQWTPMATPAPIDFEDAPAGVYSKVTFQLDGHLLDSSYELHGHVTVAGTSFPFEVEDRDALSLSLECNRTLPPGGSITITARAKFTDALKNVDWTKVRIDEGVLKLETTDPQMPAFRATLAGSFSIDDSGPT